MVYKLFVDMVYNFQPPEDAKLNRKEGVARLEVSFRGRPESGVILRQIDLLVLENPLININPGNLELPKM
ncbi:MAG: hypothetical protein IIY70_00795, partial [Oscillospiraceae bacterium]|nr:hypothetical protein [Oscillospiraceae bacterium]